MSNKFKKAIVLMVRTEMTQREIAEQLEVSEETVSRWKKRDDYEDLRVTEERKFLGDLSSKSIQTMGKLLKARSELVRFNAAKDILDRTGHKPVDKQDVNIRSVTFVDDVPSDDDG